MKKLVFIFIVLLSTVCLKAQTTNNGNPLFFKVISISPSKQVVFSAGNLQFNESQSLYRFAFNQYDTIGAANLSEQTLWKDLFSWRQAKVEQFNISGDTSLWKLLSRSEWQYLLCERSNAAKLVGFGTVANVHGIILLPDLWYRQLNRLKFTSLKDINVECKDGKYDLQGLAYFGNNIFTTQEWNAYEINGAVFIPTPGYVYYQYKTQKYARASEQGVYWIPEINKYFSDVAYKFVFNTNEVNPNSLLNDTNDLCAIRLVKEIEDKEALEWDGSISTWTKGAGTQTNPYLIETPAQLACLSELVNSGVSTYANVYFKQTNNFILGFGNTWSPIGINNQRYFEGNYDGGGKYICDIAVKSSDEYGGFFGYIKNSTIKDVNINGLTLSGSDAYGADYCGSLAGMASNCKIIRCNINCDISTSYGKYVGGIIGYSSNCKFINCTKYGSTTGTLGNFGTGIGAKTGGIIGRGSDTELLACINFGNVIATGYSQRCGGLIGETSSNSKISYCYCNSIIKVMSTGDGGQKGGGLSGEGGNFYNCYFAGSFDGIVTYAIGLNATCTNTYFCSNCNAGYTSPGISKSASIMTSAIFIDLINNYSYKFFEKDLDLINGGFPVLSFQKGIYPSKSASDSICDGDILIWEGDTLTESNVYTHQYGTKDYVDSISIMDLIVNPTYYYLIKDTIQIHGTYVFDKVSKKYDIPGMHYDQHRHYTVSNCDSIYELQLLVVDTTHYNIKLKCNNYKWGKVYGDGRYLVADTIEIKAEPNEHCYFVRWSDGVMDNPRTMTLDKDSSLQAIFAIDQHSVNVVAQNGTATGTGTYDYGTQVNLQVNSNAHYHFVEWNDTHSTNSSRIVQLTQDTTLYATLALDKHVITVLSQNGTAVGGGTFDYGTTTTISATPIEHYHFEKWLDNNKTNPRTITVVNDQTYTAVCSIDTYNITASGENGTIDGTGIYDYGDFAILVAKPNPGYQFVRWSDGEEYNPHIFFVEKDVDLTAYFERIQSALEDVDQSTFIAITVGQVLYVTNISDTYSVYNSSGLLVHQGSDQSIELPSKGLYIVKHESSTIKVIAQ